MATMEMTWSRSMFNRFANLSTKIGSFCGKTATWSPQSYLIREPVMSNSMCMTDRSPPLHNSRFVITFARKGFLASNGLRREKMILYWKQMIYGLCFSKAPSRVTSPRYSLFSGTSCGNSKRYCRVLKDCQLNNETIGSTNDWLDINLVTGNAEVTTDRHPHLILPRNEVIFHVTVIVSDSHRVNSRGTQFRQSLIKEFTHGIKVLICLIAQSKDLKRPAR